MNFSLVIDTSTSICAVALYQNEILLSTIALHQPNSHSEKAAFLIDELLKITKIPIQALTHLAIAKGPGSYTGLRIGFSLIKSISYGLNLPVIGYSSLLGQSAAFFSLAQQLQKPIISCLDAGRNEVYTSIYHYDLHLLHDLGPTLLPHDELEKFLNHNQVIIVGNGALKIKNYHSSSTNNAIFISHIENPTVGLGNYLQTQIHQNNYENLITFEPDYLKPVNITQSKEPKV